MSSIHTNPFVGLRAFESDESLLFFGRQQQTLELLQHLHEHHFVAIVGSSGSGKSSLIRAGLIPSLKAGYLIEERDKWLLAVMKPGQSPLYNLAKSIVCEVNNDGDETEVQQLISCIHEEGADALADYFMPVINNNTNIFLLVDQFEELFRFSADNQNPDKKNEAIEFVNILLGIAQQSNIPVYVVITMRSDFIGDCSQFYGLPEAMNKSQYLVPRLNRTQLKNVITGPLSVHGAGIEQTLLNLLLNDVGDNPDQLPVLQHALMRTWDVWKERHTQEPLSIEDYKKTGTLKSALSQHAEEAFAELETGKLKSICELVFKALTDKKLNARGVRRPQTFATLSLLTEAEEEDLKKVITTFRTNGRTFLMPPASVELTPKTVIDISHESLMRVWTRLIQWVDEESESEQVYVRLSEAALLYQQKRGGLWRNPELDIALQWKEKNNPHAVWASQINSSFEEAMAFLKLSRDRNEQEIVEKEKEQRHRLRRARTIAAVIGMIALVSLWLMSYAFRQKNEVKAQRDKAAANAGIAKKKAREADSLKNIAFVAYNNANMSKKEALEFADSALQQKLRADSLKRLTQDALEKEKNSKKEAIAAKEDADASRVKAEENFSAADKAKDKAQKLESAAERNKKASDSLAALANSRNYANKAIDELEANDITNSTADAELAYSLNKDNHGPAQSDVIYNALNKVWTNKINYTNQSFVNKYPVRCIVSAPGNFILAADESGLINTISFAKNHLQKTSSENCRSDVRSLSLSPDARHLAVVTKDGRGIIYNISDRGSLSAPINFQFTGTGRKILFENNTSFVLLSSDGIACYLLSDAIKKAGALSEDDYKAIAIGRSGTIYVASQDSFFIYKNSTALIHHENTASWKLPSGATNYVTSIAIDENERLMALGYYSGVLTVYNRKFQMLSANKFHQSAITDLQFASVAGNKLQLASASADHTVKLIDVNSYILLHKNDGTPIFEFDGAGSSASHLYGNTHQNKEEIITLEGHSKWIYGLTYTSNGSYLFSCGEDAKVIAWKPTLTDLHNAIKDLTDEAD